MPRIIPSIRAWSICSWRRASRGTRDMGWPVKGALSAVYASRRGDLTATATRATTRPERNSMSFNTFGHLFRVTTFGESHGLAIGCVVDGCPPRIPLTEADIQPYLDKRRPGQSRFTTQRHEPDQVKILSGVFRDETTDQQVTTGTPIALVIENVDQRAKDYSEIKDKYRPGHADYTFDAKYGFRDYRGGGRSSARETVCRVAAGAVAKKLLARDGIRVLGYVTRVGSVLAEIPDPATITLEHVEANPVRCPLPEAAKR